MKLADFVCFDALVPKLEAVDRDSAIKELTDALASAEIITKTAADKIAQAVINREKEASTGIGKGVAIPHVKHKDVKHLTAAIGLKNDGLDFASLDKQPVYSVILLLSPDSEPDNHLRAMELLFKHLQNDDFRRFLRQSETAEQIKETIIDVDN